MGCIAGTRCAASFPYISLAFNIKKGETRREDISFGTTVKIRASPLRQTIGRTSDVPRYVSRP